MHTINKDIMKDLSTLSVIKGGVGSYIKISTQYIVLLEEKNSNLLIEPMKKEKKFISNSKVDITLAKLIIYICNNIKI